MFVGKVFDGPADHRTLIVRCMLCGNKQNYTYLPDNPMLFFEIGDNPEVVPLCDCYEHTDNPWFAPLTMVEDMEVRDEYGQLV